MMSSAWPETIVCGQARVSLQNDQKTRLLTKQNRKGFSATPQNRPQQNLRVGLYTRVSTQDQQTIPIQTRAMREYATSRGWTIALQVKEIGSGASQRERPEQLLEAARRREIDVVLGGGWIVGAGPSRTCWRLFKNWSIWASASSG